MRDVLIVRTHQADAASIAAFDEHSALDCFDVTFCCDEREQSVEVGARNKIVFNDDTLNRLGLFPHPAAGWRCGDYFYYVTRQEKPERDFYWMIEPDALINWADKRRFFSLFTGSDTDFLAAKFGPRNLSWGWYGTVKDTHREVYGCYFPITRISGRAIDHCLNARRIAATKATRANSKVWPNDEAFVSSELFNSGFSCSDLNAFGQITYSQDSFRHTVPHDTAALLESPRDNLLYHPVRDFGRWLTNLDTNLQTRFLSRKRLSSTSILPQISRTGAAQLRSVAEALLQTAESEDDALVPLILSRHAWSARSWSQTLRHIPEEADDRRAKECTRLIDRHFGAKDRDAIATVQVGATNSKLGTLSVSSANDFEVGPVQPLRRFPRASALPYAFDFDERQLLFTLHLRPLDVLDQPFLYAAQRQKTVVVGRVPWGHLDELFGAPKQDISPVFIFSIGRTGSTLLEAIIRRFTSRTVSEPDTVTQLAVNGRRLESLSEEIRRQLYWHALSPFLSSACGGNSELPWTIKLRSQANMAIADIVRTFPRAKYVFMLRKRLPWARSTYRAFRLSPEVAAGRLRNGMMALHTLSKSAVDSIVVDYADVVTDPLSIVGKLINIPDANEAAAQIASTMASDSQANTAVSREKTSRIDPDEDWLRAFESAWQRVRPGKIIDSLGVEID
jgi:hypothetical protein